MIGDGLSVYWDYPNGSHANSFGHCTGLKSVTVTDGLTADFKYIFKDKKLNFHFQFGLRLDIK